MDLQNATVAVTGASGMLGAYLCRELIARGARVRGVVRNPDKARFLLDEGVTFARADLNDRAALKAAFDGVDAVVSNAALYSMTNMSWDDNYRANKTGTENVYGAVADAGVRRVVQISTCGVYKLRPGLVFREDQPQIDGSKRQGGAYRATKQLSEQIAWELSRARGIDLTVIRPAGIYGSRDPNTMSTLYRVLGWPLLPLPTLRFPFVHAGDVAQASAAALANDATIGEAYNAAGTSTSLTDLMAALKEALGRGPAVVPIPLPLGVDCDNTKSEQALGFRPRPMHEGMAEVVAGDRAFGLLPD